MLMELYFERPSLVRTFYFFDKQDYLVLHTHDLDLDVRRDNVIYLYREPIATIYSQLQYHQEDIQDVQRIVYWTELYAAHLDKWLVSENFTIKKTVLTYEAMQRDLVIAFSQVVQHFGQTLDSDRFAQIAAKVTKEEVKRKTPHDEQVIQIDNPYHVTRDLFQKEYGDFVWETLLKYHPQLSIFFEDTQ
jgi:hypothetical protein